MLQPLDALAEQALDALHPEVKELMEHNLQFQIVPPAVQYFNEYFEAVQDEEKGEWMSPTAIYDELRRIAGAGLKANSVTAFGRHLKNMPGLLQKRITRGMLYLVRKKK